jgi:hypothetical protein
MASPPEEGSEKVRLVSGTGVSNGRFLAEERQNRILIDTGSIQVEIRKEGFNLLDRVVIDGQDIIRSGDSRGIVLVDGKGQEFLASHDKDTKVTVEENGPVKAVVRVDGRHAGELGWLLEYTARLFFFKGQSRIKVQYTLRNASRELVEHIFIKSLGLEIKPTLNGEKKIYLSMHKGEKKLDLRAGDVNFYQAVSDFPWMSDGDSFYWHSPIAPDYKREKQHGYSQEGYWVRQAGQVLSEGKRDEFPDLGYINVVGEDGRGMIIGIRYMAGQWPKSLKADGSGAVMVSLWPEDNGQGYWIRYGSHYTFEVMCSFHSDASMKPADEMARFQYPLVARAPVEWYNRNVEGIYPLYHFIRFSDEKKLAGQLEIGYKMGWRKPKFKVWRYHYWGHGEFLNQHDFARSCEGRRVGPPCGIDVQLLCRLGCLSF